MVDGGGFFLLERFAKARVDEDEIYFLSFHYYGSYYDGKPLVHELAITWKNGWLEILNKN